MSRQCSSEALVIVVVIEDIIVFFCADTEVILIVRDVHWVENFVVVIAARVISKVEDKEALAGLFVELVVE